MRTRTRIAALMLPLALGCGSSGGDTAGGTGGESSASSSAMATASSAASATSSSASSVASSSTGMMMGGIPDPGMGNQVDQDFTDVEPNDTPQQATPLGVAASGFVNVWVTNNMIGGNDPADYFVFESAPAGGQFTFDACFNPGVTSMTASLSKVVNGMEQMPPLGSWNSAATCVTNMAMPVMLEPSTVYLFGLTAMGGAGTYGA